MSKSEKRYFKLVSKRHIIGRQNNYIGLFDLYTTNNKEEKIKSEFEKKYKINHFAVIKKQLYYQILDGLGNFHLNSSTWEIIKNDAFKCQILLTKDLPKQAYQLLKQIKGKAIEYEYLELLPELFDIEKKILSKLLYKNIDERELLELEQIEEFKMQQLTNLSAYKNISSKLYLFHFQKVSGSQQEKEKRLKLAIDSPLIKNKKAYLTKRAELEYLQIKALICFIEGKAKDAYNYNERLIQLVETHEIFYELYAEKYLSTLNNFLIDNLMIGKYSIVEQGIVKLNSLGERKEYRTIENINVRLFRLSFALKLNLYLTQGKFENSLQVIQELNHALAKFGNHISRNNLIPFYYLTAYLSFGNGNYKTALAQLNEIMNEKDESSVEEIFVYARFLFVIIHFEMGNYDLLVYQIKNIKKYFKSKNKLTEFGNVFLKNMEKMLFENHKSIMITKWLNFKKELDTVVKKQGLIRELNYFNYFAWVGSKIKEVNFKEAYNASNQ